MKLSDFYKKFTNTFRAMKLAGAFIEEPKGRKQFTDKQRKYRKIRNQIARESRRRNRA